MNYRIILVILAGILTVVPIIPYIADVIKQKTKPRVVTWFIWSLLTGISAVAALSEAQYTTGAFLIMASLCTFSVVLIGWKNSDKKIQKLDIVCLISALTGVLLWVIFNSPSVAVVAAVLIDVIGGIPTQVHSWKKPEEETLAFFWISCLGAVCALLTLSDWRITSFFYIGYLFLINLEQTILIICRRRYLKIKRR